MIHGEIVATIPGDPAPKGSLRCVGRRGKLAHALVEDNKKTKPWRERIAFAFRKSTTAADKGQAVGVEVTFTVRRPQHHYGTGRNAQTLRAAAPVFPVSHATGDLDKLIRTALDALQDAGVLPDDCLVVELTARKAFPAPSPIPDALPYPGALLRVYPME